MKDQAFDLSAMTVNDLFQAKAERRQRLANLPFEQKIEIVKRLQSVYPLTQVGFLTLVEDLLSPICADLGIHISRVSVAMIPHYTFGEWLYDINQHSVTIKRWLMAREESVEGWDDFSFKPTLAFGAELRTAFDRLLTEDDRPTEFGHSQIAQWRQRLPISFFSIKAANGTWIAEWFAEPVLSSDDVVFDIKFTHNESPSIEKRLQLQVQMAALSKDPSENLVRFQRYSAEFLESADRFRSEHIQVTSDNR
jgi:hypothetical protein